MSIGQRIKQRRIELGMTQTILGSKLGISQQVIGKYELGSATPPSRRVMAIAGALNVSPGWLISGSEPPTAQPKPVASQGVSIDFNALLLLLVAHLRDPGLTSSRNALSEAMLEVAHELIPLAMKGAKRD